MSEKFTPAQKREIERLAAKRVASALEQLANICSSGRIRGSDILTIAERFRGGDK